MNIPRNEHPKPQFERKNWMNLNGPWAFEIDHGESGAERGLDSPSAVLAGTITVPFCPESELSGVGYRDFMKSLWYQKKVTLTGEQVSGKTFLHFGAVDYVTDVYVNGMPAGHHKGGYVSFAFDVSSFVREGENTITVHAMDNTRDPMVPRGKQCEFFRSQRCDYTRTTGIWQTVWLEFTPLSHIRDVSYDGNISTGLLTVKLSLAGTADLSVTVTYEGREMAKADQKNASGAVLLSLPLKETHLWEPGHGRLYDVLLSFGEDTVKSYCGLRSVELEGYKFLINGKSVFQRLVLDQGFYPDGIYTAPTDRALEKDIDLALSMGFNGARPHQKIFEERYLYHADRKGYLLWGEYPNWGLDHTDPMALYSILPEWTEELLRDKNHPSIIGWCPFNETWNKHGCAQYDDLLRQIYRTTKAIDPSRPCIDTSGNFHVETDIFDVHDYNQDPVGFKRNYDGIMEDGILFNRFLEMEKNAGLQPRFFRHQQDYTPGLPTFMSEYGGIRWTKDMAEKEKGQYEESDVTRKKSWGYGKDVENLQEFKWRFKGLTDALLDNRCFFGLCYTQLYDIEQEQNGLCTYDRTPKFDTEWIKSVLSRKAAIED